VGGLVSNFESIDVYFSWDDLHGRVERKKTNFERLWDNLTSGLNILEFPIAAKHRLLRFRPQTRPEVDPESDIPIEASVFGRGLRRRKKIDIPLDIKLRDYQEAACQAWMSNQGRGLLTMATGSGKTITALASVVRMLREQGNLFVVITAPFQHLVDQWADEARRFGFQPILAYQSRQVWESLLNSRTVDYNLGNRGNVFLITTHSTFIADAMQESLSRVKGSSLLVADEVHHLGAIEGRKNLPEVFSYRMGLSATPKRWFDEEGTTALGEYFGSEVFEFTLKEAIAEGCLSRYYYYPLLVELTADELGEYERLTQKIAQLFERGAKPDDDPALAHFLRKRAEILNKAFNKIGALAQLIEKEQDIHHALFYCVPGQIDEVTRLLGNKFNIRNHRFTVEESAAERKQLLDSFAKGELQALVAIRCLDEGVDVPATRVAYLLASSSNPREFIQRRGRILRKAPGKDHAIIHDMITVPSLFNSARQSPEVFNTERKILKKELARFREFADSAENRFQANQVIWDMAKKYNMLDF
jgi:DNA phosphorothioation system restriction enzyme